MSGDDLQENWIYVLEMIFRRTEEGLGDDFQEN